MGSNGQRFLFVTVTLLPGLFLALFGGGGALHNPSDGTLPENSLVRIYLEKEMDGILVRDRFVPQAKVVEMTEFVGVVVDHDGHIVSYVGDHWPQHTTDSYRFRAQAHDGKVYNLHLVGVDQRLSLAVLKSPQPLGRAIDYSPRGVLKHFTVVSAGTGSWTTAGPCVRDLEEKQWLPVKKLSLSGLDLSCSWVGSPVLDLEGRLLGILTQAEAHPFTRKFSVAYMLAEDVVRSSVKEVTERRDSLSGGWLGVYLDDDPAEIRIGRVSERSPAERAGFRSGDVITEMEGQRISMQELKAWIRWKGPGENTRFTVLRDNRQLDLGVRLGRLVQQRRTAYALDLNRMMKGAPPVYKVVLPTWIDLGFELDNVDERWVPGYSQSRPGGILVRRVRKDSEAFKAGFRAGDLLFSINGNEVFSLADLERLSGVVEESSKGDPLEVRYLRGGKFATIKLSKP